MKKAFALLFAAITLFSLTACINGNSDSTQATEPSTLDIGETVVADGFCFKEYDTYAIITDYIGEATSINLPISFKNKPVTSFGIVFRRNFDLISIAIPETYETIEENAFAECSNLKRVVIKDGVKKICKNAFYGCEQLGNIFIPQSVTTIEEDAFLFCSDLIVEGYEGSAAQAFADGLNSLYFRDTVEYHSQLEQQSIEASVNAKEKKK